MRRRKPPKRQLIPDVKYNSELVSYLINIVMKKGKKATAQKIVYGAFDQIREKSNQDPLEGVPDWLWRSMLRALA